MGVSSINVGTSPNDSTGDSLRASFQKCNANFLLVQFPSTQTAAGSSGGSQTSGYSYNDQELTGDQAATSTGGGSINGWQIKHTYGGPLLTGARQTLYVESNLSTATSSSNTNRNYVAIVSAINANSGDGGTNTAGGQKGNVFALNLNARANSGATNLSSVVGCEADVVVSSGATTYGRFGYTAVSWGSVNGASYDAAFAVATANGQTASWKVGLLIGKTFWGSAAPLTTDGAVIATDGASSTIATGMDLSSLTITGNFLKGPNGFAVGGDGKITGANSLANYTITADGAVKAV